MVEQNSIECGTKVTHAAELRELGTHFPNTCWWYTFLIILDQCTPREKIAALADPTSNCGKVLQSLTGQSGDSEWASLSAPLAANTP